MKVPTYTSQSPIPRQGQGQFITAQLSASAMTAPGRAFADAGAQMSQSGKQLQKKGAQIADFGIKQQKIADDRNAADAANGFELDIEQRKEEALKMSDTVEAEKYFLRGMKSTEGAYRSKLKRAQAKSLFSEKTNDIRTRAVLSFRKENRKRVVDQFKAELNQTEEYAIRNGADVSKSVALRNEALRVGLERIKTAAPEIGYDEAQTRMENFTKSTVSNTLTNMINAQGADAIRIISEFRSGNSKDPIIKQAQTLLTPDEMNKIADNALKAANRVVKAREDARKAAAAEANAKNDGLYNSIVNSDLSDPEQRKLALAAHERLLQAGYYETPAKRTAVESFLDLKEDGGAFRATPESEELQADLEEKESLDTLTYDDLSAARGKVDPKFHGRMLQQLEGDRTQSEKDGIDLFKDAFMYTEQADAALLKTPSRMAFRKASLQFKEWVSQNRRASPDEVRAKARKIIKEMQDDFTIKMRKFRQQEYIVAYSKIPAAFRKFIPDPAKNPLDAVKAGVAKALTESNDRMLQSFQKLLNDEAELQILE